MAQKNSHTLEISGLPEIFLPWKERIWAGIATGRKLDGSPGSLAFSPGISKGEVLRNRQAFCEQMEIEPENLHALNQVHGNRVIDLSTLAGAPKSPIDGDGMILQSKNHCAAVFTADCTPLLLYDPIKHIGAAIHAGWRGTLAEISVKALVNMCKINDSSIENIAIYIGPAAGSCCYQVDQSMIDQFVQKFPFLDNFYTMVNGKPNLNIREVHRQMFLNMGLKDKQIQLDNDCTICSPKKYPSYRREKDKALRATTFILLK